MIIISIILALILYYFIARSIYRITIKEKGSTKDILNSSLIWAMLFAVVFAIFPKVFSNSDTSSAFSETRYLSEGIIFIVVFYTIELLNLIVPTNNFFLTFIVYFIIFYTPVIIGVINRKKNNI